VRQQPPGTTAAYDLEDGIQELTGMVGTGTATGLSFGYEGLEDGPLLVGKVGGIRSTGLHSELLGSWKGAA
jgi:hypothetical protein